MSQHHEAESSEKIKRVLAQAIQSHGANCYFCWDVVVQVSSIPVWCRVTSTHDEITWRTGNRMRTAKIASLEHMKPISDGGLTDASNCVPCCKTCNEKRGAEHNGDIYKAKSLV